MLDKLRRKFILIIMALVTAALAIMAGVILYINYQQLSHDVVQAVEYATTDMRLRTAVRTMHQRPMRPHDARAKSGAPG